MRSRSESWCPEGLREALASESDDLDRQNRRFQSSPDALSRQGEEEGGEGGRRRKEGEGGGVWREEGGERRKEEGIFQTVQSAYLPFQPVSFSSVDSHVGSDG